MKGWARINQMPTEVENPIALKRGCEPWNPADLDFP